jgi:hypothetical protein
MLCMAQYYHIITINAIINRSSKTIKQEGDGNINVLNVRSKKLAAWFAFFTTTSFITKSPWKPFSDNFGPVQL